MTFSIIARDPESGLLGCAVSTAVPCVGALVPYVQPGVGVIATQSYASARLGLGGLKLLEQGMSPEEALTMLLADDERPTERQVAGIDSRGRVYAYSGDDCVDWFGHRTGDNYAAQGNMLVGKETIDAMAETFESTRGHISSRLLKALEAGQAAGGDKRGRESAALLVAPFDDDFGRIDIRVDFHDDPVAELRRIFHLMRARYQQSTSEAGEAADR